MSFGKAQTLVAFRLGWFLWSRATGWSGSLFAKLFTAFGLTVFLRLVPEAGSQCMPMRVKLVSFDIGKMLGISWGHVSDLSER